MPADNRQPDDIYQYVVQENVTEAIEAERRMMARALEETVISQLNLLLSQTNIYAQTMHSQEALTALSVLTALTKQTLQQARDLENTLHPTILDSLGLEPALEALANQETRAQGVRVVLALQRLPKRLPQQIELALFRFTQETLDRAIRQANAGTFTIRLEKDETELRFSVQDDGIPFTGETVTAFDKRLRASGWKLDVISDNRRGSTFQIIIPLKPSVRLTEREHDVLAHLTTGLTNKEIAQQLHVSPRTVKFHLDNIYSKLGVNTRTEAAIYALQHGWSLSE